MELIKPELLKRLIQHDKLMTFAMAMLRNRWANVIAKYGPQTKIDSRVVVIAKALVQSGLIRNQLDFKNYSKIRKYLVKNDVYLSPSGRQELLRPFRE